MAVTPIEVHIEVVSYTPDGEPVHIHYRGTGVTAGPLATSNICHTTQADLAARAGKGDGYWSDAELVSTLEDHLAECGLSVTVTRNPGTMMLEQLVPKMVPVVEQVTTKVVTA